jgi:hypothetical protein
MADSTDLLHMDRVPIRSDAIGIPRGLLGAEGQGTEPGASPARIDEVEQLLLIRIGQSRSAGCGSRGTAVRRDRDALNIQIQVLSCGIIVICKGDPQGVNSRSCRHIVDCIGCEGGGCYGDVPDNRSVNRDLRVGELARDQIASGRDTELVRSSSRGKSYAAVDFASTVQSDAPVAGWPIRRTPSDV